MREWLLGLLAGRGVWLPLLAFVLLGALVFAIASRLTRHADAISEATGLGRVWIGTVLLSVSTSLPELTTVVSAARLGVPDIGIGDLMGATLSNMLVLALLDLSFARRRILQQVATDHALAGMLAIVLTGIVGLGIAAGGLGRVGPVGLDALLVAGLYLFGMRAVYAASRGAGGAPPEKEEPGASSRPLLRRGLVGLGVSALGLLAVAPLLVLAAEAVALEAGLSHSFVGTTLMGITTTFPEIATTIAALRMGALDLAIGNLFGSVAFNMCLVLAMDLATPDAPVLAQVAAAHVQSAQAAVLCVALAMLGILARAQRRAAMLRVESALIVVVYGVAVWLLARAGA